MSSSPEVFTPPHSDLEVSPPGQHQVTVADKFYADQPPQSAVPPNYYYASPESDARKQRTICGVRPATFFLSLALVVVTLVAAIGGGVGGTMAVNNAKSANVVNSNAAVCTSTVFSTASATPTSLDAFPSSTASGTETSPTSSSSTTSSIIMVPTAGTVFLDCPTIDGTQIQMNLGSPYVFNLVCGRDFPGAKNDIVALTVYSVDDCARACASMNRNSGNKICKGAAYKSDLTLNVPVNYGNCWLKNTTSTPSDTKGKNDLVALLLQ
ncbi:uncharacterized protein RCO7_02513 [Rhynchosporium graminicola]|uniref:Apple domain-containing protein n=1 Tax=Rhynchosporium graminicola TaxID=2792576 RepID=A0A1E1JUM1_9HELO|nr:uncharacterized protein RCO7_02513 [Rhynchosporium commune]